MRSGSRDVVPGLLYRPRTCGFSCLDASWSWSRYALNDTGLLHAIDPVFMVTVKHQGPLHCCNRRRVGHLW